MGLRARGPVSVGTLRQKLRSIPRTVAAKVAPKAAEMMTEETRGSFASGQTVYGDARPNSVDGEPLTLEKTGAIKEALRFTSEGTRTRAVLGPQNSKGVNYGRFLIGKYDILPNGPLPLNWRSRLGGLFKAQLDSEFKGGGQ